MPAMKLSRRAFLSRAGLVGAGLALAACAPKAAPTSAPAPTTASGEQPATAPTTAPAPAQQEAVTIRFMTAASADQLPVFQQSITEDFESVNPGITVALEPRPDGWEQQLLTQMIAGTAADVFQAWGEVYANWIERDLILDLQPLVDRDMTAEDIADFNDFQWEALVMKGTRVGMPKYINTMTISFNRDMFDKYGVDYPPEDGNWNRDDYRELLGKLYEAARSAGDNNVWPGWLPAWEYDRLWGPLRGWDGWYVAEKYGKECLLDSDAAQAGMQYFYDLMFKDNFHAQAAQVEDKWETDSIAAGMVMLVESSTQPINREKVWAEQAGINWDMRHVPFGPTGKRAVLGTSDSWAITAQSKHQEESWKLLQFMTGTTFQQKAIVESSGLIPVRKQMIDAFIDTCRELHPRMKDVRLETVKELLNEGYAEDAPWFCNQLAASDIIVPALQKVFQVGDVGPEYFKEIVPQVNQSQADCTVSW